MLGSAAFAVHPVGEDGQTIKPTLAFLHRNGIGALVGYSAESDVAAGATALFAPCQTKLPLDTTQA